MPSIADNNELIERAKAQDNDAFLSLFSRNSHVVDSIVRRFIPQIIGYDEEDIIQEILLRTYQMLPYFRGNEVSFKAWLHRTTTGICLNLLNKQRKIGEMIPFDTIIENYAGLPYDSGKIRNMELYWEISDIMTKLPKKLRAVVALRYIQGLKYDEIAKALNIKVGTVKSRINSANFKIRTELQKKE